MIARYSGRCARTGRVIRPGDTIRGIGRGRYILIAPAEPAEPAEPIDPINPIDPDLMLAQDLDPELAQSDPEAAAAAGAYLRRSLSRGVSDIWMSGGREYYRNRRGVCEDAPCCGCCNA